MPDSDPYKNFEEIYVSYFAKLRRFARNYVISEEEAENIVHDILANLWDNWDERMHSYVNLNAYLFMSVKNKCIDYLRRRLRGERVKDRIQEDFNARLKLGLQSLEALDMDLRSQEDVERMISEALAVLPDRCREIFIKHKFEGKKYKDIALELNISVNTVENHMASAYKKLREHLKHLLVLLVFLLY